MSTSTKAPERLKIDTTELQSQQLGALENPDASAIETTTGNVDSDYEFPKHEQHLMHVELTKKVNDAVKKEYRTDKTVWKGSAAQYTRMATPADKGGTGSFDEYDSVKILHDVRPGALARPAAATTPTTGTGDSKKTLRTKADYVARYEELAATAEDLPEDLRKAPADATIEQLKAAIADLETGAAK